MDGMVYILILYRTPNKRPYCEANIVECYIPVIVDSLTAEPIIEGIQKVRHCHHKILIKEVQYHFTIPQVVQTSVVKNQAPKVLKFSKRKISALGCSLSLITEQSNAYMGLFNHAHVIRTIPNCKRYQLRIVGFYHLNYLSLFPRV